MTYTHAPTGRLDERARASGDVYLRFLGAVLIGYALFSRSFAYLGVPPLFIGEITLALGAVVLLRAGGFGRVAERPIFWVLAAYVALAVVRTVPFLGEHGLDAPRDAMQVFYAAFAVIVAGLVMRRPERLRWLVEKYAVLAVSATVLLGGIYLVGKTGEASLPKLPWGDVRVIEAKGGDMMVHLTGITLFLMMGFHKRHAWLLALLVIDIAAIAISNRGGMVAFILGCGVAWVLRPRTARVGKLAYVLVFFLVAGSVAGQLVEVKIHGGTRSLSVEQLVTNVKSVFGGGESSSLDGTKKWRLDWWEKIWTYTVVDGTYFWDGKGFGVNLAKSDGFLAVKDLRSPHNGHMTILARMGVPGLALWLLLQLMWAWLGLAAWSRARLRGDVRWQGFLAMLAGYWIAFHVNASFDVYFEGPMGGIWFWTVWGVGIAAFWIERTRPDVLDGLPIDGEEAPRRPTAAWTGLGDAAPDPAPPGDGWARPAVPGGWSAAPAAPRGTPQPFSWHRL